MTERAAAWVLDRPAFERLLAFLDADRQVAADKYEDIRRRLLKLFAWRGCLDAEDCADRTIDRVARRVMEGTDVHAADPYAYFHGVALNVLREHWRDPQRSWEPIDEPHMSDRSHAAARIERESDRERLDRQLACLETCLDTLLPRQRELLIEYHRGDRHIEQRLALAASLEVPLNALRIRVHRIRIVVERCVERCASGEPRSETNRPGAHQEGERDRV